MIALKFNGYTFRPVRKLSDGETGAMLTQRLESDLEHRAVFSRANGGKYSHAAFYAAMGKTDADIFTAKRRARTTCRVGLNCLFTTTNN